MWGLILYHTRFIQILEPFKEMVFEKFHFQVRKSDFRLLPFREIWRLQIAFFGVGPLLNLKSTCQYLSKMVSWAFVDLSGPILEPFEVKKWVFEVSWFWPYSKWLFGFPGFQRAPNGVLKVPKALYHHSITPWGCDISFRAQIFFSNFAVWNSLHAIIMKSLPLFLCVRPSVRKGALLSLVK